MNLLQTKIFLALALLVCADAHVFSQTNVLLPTIPTNTYYVTNFGALGDNAKDNTTNIQNCINAASTGGGGVVEITTGNFLSGPLTMKSSINLKVDGGAVLRMLPLDRYPGGVTNGYNFITASSLHDIAITGPGAIDGQGAPWWPYANTNGALRPRMIAPSSCSRLLIQFVTLSNSPMFHIAVGGKSANVTVQGVIIRAPSSSDPVTPGHNTDACDVSGTNIIVRDCDISVGDDNYTCGGSTSDVLLTNNTYGNGHGVSIGSYTSPSVSNITVINCTFNNTDQGIRIKSDRDRGGLVQNIRYYNLSMTNVLRPILIYTCYTNTNSIYRAVDSITPAVAASYPSAAVISTTPTFRNITISNLTATTPSGRTAGLIWGLPEMSISNVTLANVKINGGKTFGLYNVKNVKVIDSAITVPSGTSQFSFFNSQITFTNSAPSNNVVTLDGATTNTTANQLTFYNAAAALQKTNALAVAPVVMLGAATFTVSNHLALSPASQFNFVLGTNAATVAVRSNLVFDGNYNFIAGAGFTNGSFTLFNYGGALTFAAPTNVSAPSGYNYSFDTNTAGQVRLLVSQPSPPSFASISLNGTQLVASGTSGYSNGNYTCYLLASTNLTLPSSNWTRLATNSFSATGGFTFTNPVGSNAPLNFFRVMGN
ncbi:MAG: hypothetical protein RLZZ350_1141 [Verrucomicrobiota bacterium]|jgi:polygalacturonase